MFTSEIARRLVMVAGKARTDQVDPRPLPPAAATLSVNSPRNGSLQPSSPIRSVVSSPVRTAPSPGNAEALASNIVGVPKNTNGLKKKNKKRAPALAPVGASVVEEGAESSVNIAMSNSRVMANLTASDDRLLSDTKKMLNRQSVGLRERIRRHVELWSCFHLPLRSGFVQTSCSSLPYFTTPRLPPWLAGRPWRT